MHYSETRTAFTHFLTEVCAIVGGAVTVTGCVLAPVPSCAVLSTREAPQGRAWQRTVPSHATPRLAPRLAPRASRRAAHTRARGGDAIALWHWASRPPPRRGRGGVDTR